jgi:hypothetical protein
MQRTLVFHNVTVAEILRGSEALGHDCIFCFLRVLCAVWQVQGSLYPFHMFLYLYGPYLVTQIHYYKNAL